MNKHSLLARAQAKVAGVLLAIILGLTGAAGISQAVSHDRHETAVEVVEERAHFYRVIGGEESASSPTVDNTLAAELRDRLGPVNTNATELPAAIDNFRGDSNAYGGITDAIQMDPFDETGLSCFECGPLSAEFKDKLLEIKKGNVEQVIHSELPTPESTPGYTFTPGGISTASYVGLLWLVGGPLTLLLAHRRLKDRSDYVRHFGDLSWTFDTNAELALTAMSPSFLIPYLALRRANRRRFERQVRERYPDPMRWVDEVDHMIERIPPRELDNPEVLQLQAHRDELVAELSSLTRAKGATFAHQLGDMNARLKDVQYWLTIRQELMDEHGNPEQGSLDAGERREPGDDTARSEG